MTVPPAIRRRLLEDPALAAEDRPVVERFLALCERYAELERAVLGDLSFDLPVHGVVVDASDPARLGRDAEVLADVVRELLALETPVTRFDHALEAHGARVFSMPLDRGTLGVFFFAGEIAPAFLVNGRLAARAVPVALAHLYAHFLVDVDPYEPMVCRSARSRTTHAPRERFADAFAEALLVPRRAVAPFLEGTDEESADIDMIASYLDLPPSFVNGRLAGLGVAGADTGMDDDDWWDGSERVVYPERLVALALEGIHEDTLDVDEFAAWLGLEREDALALLALSAAAEADGEEPRPSEDA